MLTKEQFGFINNEKNYYQYFENDLDLGVIGVLSSIASEDSLLPKFLGYSLNSKTTGWNIVRTKSTLNYLFHCNSIKFLLLFPYGDNQ